ncbi:MAG TPA: glutamate racemase [Rhizobacter sp.]|nr:glutamate racemase [Rhizobacter sp.]
MSTHESPLIGVFDSGVGGLSVLKAVHQQLPGANLLYVADSAHAPYGERTDEFIVERSHRIASHLLAQGAGLLVLACNTATAMAAASLRFRWPSLPIVAVEPGLKPAVAISRNGRIGVMATPATLRSDKFQRLLSAHSSGIEVFLQPCPGLAGLIEHGNPEDPKLLALVQQFSQPLKQAQVDTVVLGCTHYPFIAAQIQAAFGADVKLVDTADAVARQAARLVGEARGSVAQERDVLLQTTGNANQLADIAQRWLPFACKTENAPGL